MYNLHQIKHIKPTLMRIESFNKVLLIEDNPGDARLVELLLKESDLLECEIINKTTLKEGILAIEQEDFDVILLDLSLPDSRGFPTLEKLVNRFPDQNIIVLTGFSDKKMGLNAVRAGAQDYLVKGAFDANSLAKSLRYSIERSKVIKRLEEAQRLAHIGNWEFYPSNKEFVASDEVYRIFGYPPRENTFIYEHFANPNSHLNIIHQVHEDTLSNGNYQGEHEVLQRDGEQLYVSIQTKVSKDNKGQARSISGIIQDITEKKKADEIRKMQESDKMKREFLARISHDMRTPMTAVIGFSSLFPEMNLNEEQKGYIKSIKQTSEDLLGIINDILDFSMLESGDIKFAKEPFDFHELMANLFNVVYYRLPEKRLEFETSINENIPRYLIGDRTRLNQILINLTGNAAKFTEQGSIKISVDLLPSSDNGVHLKFSVADTGIGIPADKLDSIFGAFARVETKGMLFEGTGLGLSIVKHLVEKQGGKVGVESELGVGSTFYFDLKFKVDDVSARASSIESIDAPPRFLDIDRKDLSVLLVEDNNLIQIVAKRYIQKHLSEVQLNVVENGEEAIKALRQNEYDIVLMDLQMPVMNGYEATAYIRTQMDVRDDLPILAVTADAPAIEKDKSFLEHGFNDVVSKPFKGYELFEKMSLHLLKK